MGTYIVLTALVLIAAAAIRSLLRDKKQGKSTCGGNCACCKGCCEHRS